MLIQLILMYALCAWLKNFGIELGVVVLCVYMWIFGRSGTPPKKNTNPFLENFPIGIQISWGISQKNLNTNIVLRYFCHQYSRWWWQLGMVACPSISFFPHGFAPAMPLHKHSVMLFCLYMASFKIRLSPQSLQVLPGIAGWSDVKWCLKHLSNYLRFFKVILYM